MASPESNNADHVVELIVRDASSSPSLPPSSDETDDAGHDQIAPLLSHPERPKINIFTASYPRRKPRDEVTRLLESETSPFTQFILWVWNGSRYSGLLCMALSSTIYFLMGVLSNIFSVQAIPLFETAFTRSTIILILSYLWLRRSEQPLFGTSHVRIILLLRALAGCISMSSFVYCFQRLPFSEAIVLNSTTPVMASIMARVFLREKLKISDIAGLACSFFGVLFFFREMLATQGQLVKADEASNGYAKTSHHIFTILIGFFSSIIGGTSYCLIRAGAKASDQPLLTVFSFGILASPAMGLCTYIFEDFVLPGFQSILLMLVLGILAFFAEVLLARGLQLERTGKVANIQYME
ncbi:EamA domain, partial [Sesbania bispinosa]